MSQHESVSPTTIWGLTLAGWGVALLIIWGFVAQRQQQEAAQQLKKQQAAYAIYERNTRLLYTSDAVDDIQCVDNGGRLHI